jgi:TRAP-type C4-dicarboxylate transport system substrate-binding protein
MFIRRKSAVVAAAFAAVAAGASCGDAAANRAGDNADSDPVVLTISSASNNVPVTLEPYIDRVSELTDGSLTIEWVPDERSGDPDVSPPFQDVRDGQFDMGFVRLRVFDTLGVDTLQPLIAPLLIDSYELEQAVLDSGVTAAMLESLDALDVRGVAVIPGALLRIAGRAHQFLGAADFEGETIANTGSEVGEAAYSSLGATAEPWIPGSPLSDYDAIAMQFQAIFGRGYHLEANAVTSNLIMWPAPSVIVVNTAVFESLTDSQQQALHAAAGDTMTEMFEAVRTDEDGALAALCDAGLPIVTASDEQLAVIRAAVQPVYDEIASDGDNAEVLEQIEALKEDLAGPPDGPVCEPEPVAPGAEAATTIRNGT